jgi:WD40 repeat protein
LASSSDDNTVRVWDAVTGQQVDVIQSTERVDTVDWSPDGSKLAYNGAGSMVQIVPAPSIVSCSTTIPASDTTSLIAAITSANGAGTPQTLCLTSSTYILTAANNTTDGANGLPSITGDITIVGDGATITRAGAAPAFRLFQVAVGGRLALENMSLTNGSGWRRDLQPLTCP